MPDKVFFPLMLVIAVALIALAAVWPQGLGDRSPGPFGHTPVMQTPEMKARMAREAAKEAQMRAQSEAAAARAEAAASAPITLPPGQALRPSAPAAAADPSK